MTATTTTTTTTTKFIPYYTLLTFETDTNQWYPQWGAYSRAEVVAEREDYRRSYAAKHLRIVAVDNDSQACIDAVIQKLNRGGSQAA